MPQTRTILQNLCGKLLQLYCPESALPRAPGRTFCTRQFMLALSNYWNLPLASLPGEETIYNAMHQRFYSDATKEKFAIFYYAFTDADCRAQMNGLYLGLHSQRPATTPYWDRFVEEYNRTHPHHAPKFVLPNPLEESLKQMPREEFLKLKNAVAKVERERERVHDSVFDGDNTSKGA